MKHYDQAFYERQATRGATMLDERHPEWWRKIVFARLEMQRGCNCIVGQVEGGYWEGLAKLNISRQAMRPGVTYGFNIPNEADETGWVLLRNAWVSEVRSRRTRKVA